MKKKGRDSLFKCIFCGKYIAYKDIGTDKIGTHYEPDSEFTTETFEYWHKSCEKRINFPKNRLFTTIYH